MFGRRKNKPLDWQGNEVRCDACRHAGLKREGRCALKLVCVMDRSSQGIEAFFSQNPDLSQEYLAHPYFEVRAAAARYADVFYLTALLNDEDETVRWNAALRLPHRFLLRMRSDPHREVRIRVAEHLEGEELVSMMSDPDYFVRQTVAKRIGIPLLKIMMDDPDPEVRRIVANRIAPEWLVEMLDDPDATVCLAAVERLTSTQILHLRFHENFRVRYEVARRIPVDALEAMRKDADPLVRELVEERMHEARMEQRAEHEIIEINGHHREGRQR